MLNQIRWRKSHSPPTDVARAQDFAPFRLGLGREVTGRDARLDIDAVRGRALVVVRARLGAGRRHGRAVGLFVSEKLLRRSIQ